MGHWNRRNFPRKKCRYDQYEEPSVSCTRLYNSHSYSNLAVGDKKTPSWEIDYCRSLKVPWNKILACKEYIYCYPSVLNWDDSAGKEAFQNAKRRYWAMINDFPCEETLPDPDMFIEEINWNTRLDPELMQDLDQLYFNPDGLDMTDDMETINEEDEHAPAQDHMKQRNVHNPWEVDPAQPSASLEDKLKGWRQIHDPWEANHSQLADSSKHNTWGSGNESWGQAGTGQQEGWKHRNSSWSDNAWRSSLWSGDAQPWSQAGIRQQEGWERRNSTWGHGNDNGREFGNDWRQSWKKNHPNGSKERGRRDEGYGCKNPRESEYQGKDTNSREYRRFGEGCGSSLNGGQKRKSSQQHKTEYWSTKY